MDRRQDPRTIVTPYAFAVHPDLVGRPLATPWQRLGAILVDLIVIGFLSLLGGVALALGSIFLLFWLALRKPAQDVIGKMFRVAVGCLAVLILVIAVVVVVAVRYGDDIATMVEERVPAGMEETLPPGAVLDSASESGAADAGPEGPGLMDVIESARGAMAFRNAQTREDAQAIANRLARNGRELGLTRREIRESLGGLIPEDAPWEGDRDEILEAAVASLPPVSETVGRAEAETRPQMEAPSGSPDPSALSSRGDSGGPIQDPQAVDSIQALNEELLETRAQLQGAQEDREDYRDRLARVEENLAEAQKREGGIFDWLRNLIDELGLGFGWAALYMTITHTWWKGTSVGKRLFRIRVVMIDKRPLNLWLSFERAGGYAAGFATGLLGFAQIFWDPNRQAIHDKVSETIVIQDGRDPVPGPWIQEGKAQWTRGRSGATGP